MGKKSRKKFRKDWVTASPDEIISHGPLRIERYGRFISFSNRSTPEEHKAFLKRSEEVNKSLLSQLEVEVPALQSLIQKYDPVELLHRAAYMLLPLFMKYRSENELEPKESYYLPTVEYLQYLVARTFFTADCQAPSESEWTQIWEEATKVLQLTQSYLPLHAKLSTDQQEINPPRRFPRARQALTRGVTTAWQPKPRETRGRREMPSFYREYEGFLSWLPYSVNKT
jgi:hypothetical protein